ncbi:MAG: alpha/beta fold hydrolase [Bifidobacteriaceae bacterium]|jgi:triacylglycerol esterase/lipase EstA (alpha/beta hydrolase family)|nr:alpha/beta fold hydrolase [Bifidobacteriaceae bacterium]
MNHHPRRFRAAVIAGLTVLGTLAGTAPALAAPAHTTPARTSRSWSVTTGDTGEFGIALLESVINPSLTPSGVNPAHCTPSAAHPDPVVLIHGTWENAYDNWAMLGPNLVRQGYCVYAPNYGNSTGITWLNGTGDLITSANQIAAYIRDTVVPATGTTKVDLVGHSQGGSQARYVADILAPQYGFTVGRVVGITPSNHATTFSNLVNIVAAMGLTNFAVSIITLLRQDGFLEQMEPDAQFYQDLNGSDETVPGIAYTVIATTTDELVTPYTQAFLTAGQGATVNNVTLQQVCPWDLTEHITADYDKNVVQLVLNALDPANTKPVTCSTYLIPLH